MADIINAVAALWFTSGFVAWVAVLDQRIQSLEIDLPLDFLMVTFCIICGPITFWIAKVRVYGEEWV